MHDGAFVLVLNVPLGQVEQVRSEVDVPVLATQVPAPQLDHGVHDVASLVVL